RLRPFSPIIRPWRRLLNYPWPRHCVRIAGQPVFTVKEAVMSAKVTVDRARTASFDVDAQNTFTPVCPDELPVAGGTEIVPELNAMARLASLRLGSKDAHSPKAVWVADADNPPLSPLTGHANADIRWPVHAVPGTKGFELI